MTIEDQIRDEKLQFYINRRLQRYHLYNQIKLISMNILLVKRYCHLINSKELNKLNLLILFWEKLLKDKQKQSKIKEENKLIMGIIFLMRWLKLENLMSLLIFMI